MSPQIAEVKRKNQAGQLADRALAHDRAAYLDWWYLVEKKLRGRGIVERLFARAYLAGFADGRADPADDRPAPMARANERRAS